MLWRMLKYVLGEGLTLVTHIASGDGFARYEWMVFNGFAYKEDGN